MQKISRIVARVGPKGKETQPVTRASSPFWAWAHDSTKRRSERRARKRGRERSSRRRRSAPFDLACNPVGPRGLTDVMRGVRGPVRTRRYRLSVRCVRCTRLWICPYGPYGARRGGGCKSRRVDEWRNGTTLAAPRNGRWRRWWGAAFLNYAVVISRSFS